VPDMWTGTHEATQSESSMTQAQTIALENHCRLSCETLHPRFTFAGLGWTRILTVNSGYE
jgi:hypothetical protein